MSAVPGPLILGKHISKCQLFIVTNLTDYILFQGRKYTEAYRCLIMLHYKYNVAIKYIAL